MVCRWTILLESAKKNRCRCGTLQGNRTYMLREVSDYKSLKQERFNEVLEFLDEWYTTAMGSSAENSS